jgi:flagellar hook-associated protein 1
MSINFSAFEIGRRALNASQVGINITGQNIANVNTAGYTRRHVSLAESTTNNLANGFQIGTGVTVQGVTAFRDSLLQSRIQTETGIAGRLTAFRDTLAPIEAALVGSEEGGLQNALTSFFGAFRDLDANPTSVSLRSVVVQRGQTLASSFQSTRSKLDGIRTDADQSIRTTVEQVNTLAQHIAELNGQIQGTEATSGDSSALRDQRDELVVQISEMTGAHQTLNTDGTINLTIGEGRAIVSGINAFTLQTASTPPLGLASITLGGDPAIFTEGKIRGLQDAITETSTQVTKLDGLAAALVSRVNTLSRSGTDLNGNSGGDLFTFNATQTAANISINALTIASPRLVVASALPQPGPNGTVAGAIANLMSDQNTTVGTLTGSFSSIYGSMLSDAGAKINAADNNLQTQAVIIAQATTQRDAVSGVSLDEEAINLMQYQKAFEAAARFIKVADEMTQTILSLAQ